MDTIAMLTNETLDALNMSQPESQTVNRPSQEEVRRQITGIELYSPDKPKSMVETVQISAADLCHIISERLKHYFRDVLGCTFKYNVNGNLGFCVLFQFGKGYGKFDNIDAIRMSNSMSSTQRYVETCRVNVNGRRTMTLNQFTKDFFEKYMIRPVIGNQFNGGLRTANKIDWEKCIEEVEYRESNFYSYANSSFLMLRNVDLERLLYDIWIPADERRRDYEAAKIQFRNRFFYEERIETTEVDEQGNPVIDSDKDSPTYGLNKKEGANSANTASY